MEIFKKIFKKNEKESVVKKKPIKKKERETTNKEEVKTTNYKITIEECKDEFTVIHKDKSGKELAREVRTKKIFVYYEHKGKIINKTFKVGIWNSNEDLHNKLMDLAEKEAKKLGVKNLEINLGKVELVDKAKKKKKKMNKK